MEDSNVVSAAKALLSFGTLCQPTATSEGQALPPVTKEVSTAFRQSRELPLSPSRERYPSVVRNVSDGSNTLCASFEDGSHSSNASTGGEHDVEMNTASFFEGSVSLATKDDTESLSPLHCFMRRYCVEAFTASPDDISIPRYGKSHSSRVVLGQVGIRCIHCKHRPAKMRQERAVCFPSSLKNIYHSIETWQRRHSLVCHDIPEWVRSSLSDLIERSRAGAGGRRQYWEESATKLGMVTTQDGIRFVRPPGELHVEDESSDSNDSSEPCRPSKPVVVEEDKDLVTGYLYTLLEQMEECSFTEQDRTGGRSKVKDCPVGYPGMQCKHCGGKAGFGRYFPANIQALSSANSDRNIFNHVIKCRKCPQELRDRLQEMQKEQASTKNKRGSRKKFFMQVWGRLHKGGKGMAAKTIVKKNKSLPVPVSPLPRREESHSMFDAEITPTMQQEI